MKSIQINMATLSQAQKKMCVELIAQSNIKFQQKDNQYVAQIKVHPSELKKQSMQIKQKDKTDHPKKESITALSGGKKFLARTVRIGDLKRIQELHKSIEIYVYPKRMSIQSLCQLIENSYEKFWTQHKKKSTQIKNINFAEWFYKQMILTQKDKLKIQQLLVNLIDSLNHFVLKDPGVKIFYHFLAEQWPTDALFYFLVLRGLLEQITGEKILQKANLYTSGIAHKLKYNPYEKMVSEQEVVNFLRILYSGGLSCSRSKPKPLQGIYQALTQKMFYQQSKRKNYIYFFGLLQHLTLQFMDNEVSSCDMSLSKTQFGDHSISELITQQYQNDAELFKRNVNENVAPPQVYVMEIDPVEEEKIQQRERQEKEVRTANSLQNALLDKINEIYSKINIKPSQQTIQCIQNLVGSIANLDKSLWMRYRGEITESQLYSIQKLQALYRQQTQSGTITNQLIKNILLIPALRKQIITDIGL